MIEDDRPAMDDDKDEPKPNKPRKIVDEDPNDLRAQLAKEEISVKMEVEWFTDSVEQYSYVSLPSTDSETKVAHIWQFLSMNGQTITIPTFESSGHTKGWNVQPFEIHREDNMYNEPKRLHISIAEGPSCIDLLTLISRERPDRSLIR